MTSKTFKSAWPNHPRRLHLEGNEHGVNIHVSDPEWRDVYGITIAPSDAPALALAILEAAGVTETDSPYMHEAADNLRAYILIEEKVTAEARERAELEAEALELFKASGTYGSDRLFLKPSDLDDHVQKAWLAVARRAREMRAEK